MLSYSIARPTTEGMFLKVHGHQGLPMVWLLVTVGIVLLVALYNRFVGGAELMRLYGDAALASGVVLLLLLLWLRQGLTGAHHLLYLWKDLYVVLLVEIYYSYTNSVFAIHTARWVYGLFGLLSALGGITGSLVVRHFAEPLGATALLWIVPAILFVIWLLCIPMGRLAGASPPDGEPPERPTLLQAIRVVALSRYLVLVLALVATVQVVITLVDFEFSAVAERIFPTEDRASAGIATVYGAISGVTVVLHAMTGPVLRIVGVPLTLLVIPLLLASGMSTYVALPLFATIAGVKVASKCFDYSLFRSAKELLYIPLSYTERTRGKSVVDMVVYRVAKGGASLMLIGLVSVGGRSLVTPLTLALTLLWVTVTLVIVRRFRDLVPRTAEIGSRS